MRFLRRTHYKEKADKLFQTIQLFVDWRSHTILYLSPTFLALIGYRESELIGKDLNILLPEEVRKDHHKWVKAAAIAGESKAMGRSRVVSLISKRNTQIPVTISFSFLPIDEDVFAIGILQLKEEGRK